MKVELDFMVVYDVNRCSSLSVHRYFMIRNKFSDCLYTLKYLFCVLLINMLQMKDNNGIFLCPALNNHSILCLSFVNFNICYNFWTVGDRDFIFGMHTHLLMPFQMTPRSLICDLLTFVLKIVIVSPGKHSDMMGSLCQVSVCPSICLSSSQTFLVVTLSW